MQKFLSHTIAACFALTGCGSSTSNLMNYGSKDSPTQSSFHIECTASSYQNSQWVVLKQFESTKDAVLSGGEYLQVAQFSTDEGATFAASGDYQQGIINYGMISDSSSGAWTDIQLANHKSIDLTLSVKHDGQPVQYQLSCEMKK